MPTVTVTTPHSLSQEEAATKLKNHFDKLKQEHSDKIKNLTEEWDGNKVAFSFTTVNFNMDISGDMTIEPNEVKMSGKLPFAAMMFKGQIEQAVRKELETGLA